MGNFLTWVRAIFIGEKEKTPVILTRNDTLENWKRVNPIIGDNEYAIVNDDKTYRKGDGKTRFNDLKIKTVD